MTIALSIVARSTSLSVIAPTPRCRKRLDGLVDLDLEQRLFECLDGTGDVTLDDEVERVDLALFERAGEVLEADALAGLGQLGIALDGFTLSAI